MDPDIMQHHAFIDNTFTKCDYESLTWFTSPPKSWANIEDCGDFTCTAPYNFMYEFKNN